jgi:hypothetical protein
MMRIAAIALLGLSAFANSQETEKACEIGLYGDNCNNVCIGCNDDIKCDKKTGACDDDKCVDGYQIASSGACVPECFGTQGAAGCDNGGECVAPNYCICGKSGAQVVGVTGEFPNKSGVLVEGTQCVSLRKDGIKGAFIALAVMIVSVGFCGFIEVQRNKGKSKKD